MDISDSYYSSSSTEAGHVVEGGVVNEDERSEPIEGARCQGLSRLGIVGVSG